MMKGWNVMDSNENKTDASKNTEQGENANASLKKDESSASFAKAGANPDDKRGEPANIDLLMDITLPISVELGRAKMSIKDILYLNSGSIIELNKFAGEPLDILVNRKPIAKGEVVVLDENFGIRITETIEHGEKIKTLEQGNKI